VFLSKNISLRLFYLNHSCAKKYTDLSHHPTVSPCYDESASFMFFMTIILKADVPDTRARCQDLKSALRAPIAVCVRHTNNPHTTVGQPRSSWAVFQAGRVRRAGFIRSRPRPPRLWTAGPPRPGCHTSCSGTY